MEWHTEQRIEFAAATAHEANRLLGLSLADRSPRHWTEAEAWEKNSAIDGVRALLLDPSLTPGQLHSCWMRMLEADGWHYGGNEDSGRKEHHNLLPFEELIPGEELKFEMFRLVVLGVLEEETLVWSNVVSSREVESLIRSTL